jgi:PPOX class probable F420-dependent enzyme
VAAIPDSALEVVEGDRLAHLVTIEPDGAPQVSCVWVGVEDGEIVFASLGPRRKLDNLARDPRVALSIETSETSGMGLLHYLVVHGTARITEGGGPELLQRLAHVYLGPDVKFPPGDSPPPGRIVHITVDRIGGVGPWAEA